MMGLHARKKGGQHHDAEIQQTATVGGSNMNMNANMNVSGSNANNGSTNAITNSNSIGNTGSGLHSDAEAAAAGGMPQHGSHDGEGASKIHRRRGGRMRFLPKELRYPAIAVGAFLAVGLILGFLMLRPRHHKMIMHMMRDPWGHSSGLRSLKAGFRHHFFTGHPRSVTVVMPSVVNPKNRHKRLNAILRTWGPAARAVFVVHNATEFPKGSHAIISEHGKPQDKYAFPQLLLMPPSIGVDDGLQRLNYAIRAVHQKINPDFAFFVNDHTFVVPSHLCYFLEDKLASDDMYAGHALKNREDVFNSGAAGYVLSRRTMQRLIKKWDEKDPTCLVADGNEWLQGNPGLVTTKCLKNVLNVSAVDTRRSGKWHRFHAFPLTRMVSGDVDGWYKNKHKNLHQMMETDESYSTLLSGTDCCAEDTVSFHYVESFESIALYATRQQLLERPHMTDRDLESLMMSQWPQKRWEIGAYSRGLPDATDRVGWSHLLKTVRRMTQKRTQREC